MEIALLDLFLATLINAQHWYTSLLERPDNWCLVLVGITTLLVVAYQAREMTRATKVMQRSAELMKRQTSVLENSVKAAEDSAGAAKASADAMKNSERAWIMAELGLYEGGVPVAQCTHTSPGQSAVESTVATVILTCRNEGRTPAWIDNVFGYVDIDSRISATDDFEWRNPSTFGPMAPLGAGRECSRVLELACSGHTKRNESLSAYVVVEYRDIFGIKRVTTLGYSIDPIGGRPYRQDAFPEYNRST